jgi:hypothetical protein
MSNSQAFTPNFKNGIKQWITYDLKIEELNQQAKLLREKRDTIGDQLSTYIQNHNLTKIAFNCENNRIIFKNEAKYTGLSFDFLYKCGAEYFNDQQKAQDFCQFIKNKRQKNYVSCLKRTNPVSK